ncbi:MAG: pseudouridine synthase [Anaerolineae bacterium]|nr:pseudouridine synthase [Anaerolineae bacterium]
MKERLQKLMAMSGIASRRASEEYIRAGRVRVNGQTAKIGDQADLSVDVVEVDGQRLNPPEARVYYAINKPRNVLTSPPERADDKRKTVLQMIPHQGHLFSIGRLDADSEGLVVLTDDGELAQRLSHPRYKHTKTYRVLVTGLPSPETLERWQDGVYLEEGRNAPCHVVIVRGDVKESVLLVTMTEGRKRQIRRVASILGHPVQRLTRRSIGCLELGTMKSGEWRTLTDGEISLLKTPAPELKLIRKRAAALRATRGRRETPQETPAQPPRGAGKNDDVRSERQRRYARGEQTEKDAFEPVRPARRRPAPPTGKRRDDSGKRHDDSSKRGRPTTSRRKPGTGKPRGSSKPQRKRGRDS